MNFNTHIIRTKRTEVRPVVDQHMNYAEALCGLQLSPKSETGVPSKGSQRDTFPKFEKDLPLSLSKTTLKKLETATTLDRHEPLKHGRNTLQLTSRKN